jgi:predicted amidohydrolase
MKIALAPTFCAWGQTEANFERHERLMCRAADRNADVVLFPETSIHGLWKDHMVRMVAEPLDGLVVRRMRALARQHGIAVGFGFAERTAAKPLNSWVLLDRRGRRLVSYRKNYPTGLERDYWRPHTRRPVLSLLGTKTAVTICADSYHDELWRSYRRRGVRLLLMPHAWDADPILRDDSEIGFSSMAHLVDTYARDRVARHRNHDEMLERFVAMLAPRCREHGMWAAFVNQVGQPHPLIPFVGPAFVIDPSGKVVTQTQSDGEQLLLVDLPGQAMAMAGLSK